MKNKFKVLKYGNIFVNFNRLVEGIYVKDIPTLFPMEDTIENFIEYYKGQIDDNKPNQRILESLIENLSKCKLVEV